MYKIETHLHTAHSSSCGKVDAKTIAKLYKDAGYGAIVVTDHFSRYNFGKQEWPTVPESFYGPFLEGYRLLRAECEKLGIRVYRGAEIRFDGSTNDYLLYNYPDELLQDPEALFTGGLEAFVAKSRQTGALLVQAHPYRKPCTPADPALLDGVESQNMHPRQDNQPDLALAFAQANPQLLPLCGSDFHQEQDVARGGILVDRLPEDEADLVKLLRNREYRSIV